MDILFSYLSIGTILGLYSMTGAAVFIEAGSIFNDLRRFWHY